MPKNKKKSRKERQRERQIKQERAQEAYRIRREREAERKPRQWSKGKILGAVCLLVLIFGAYAVWQYTKPSAIPAGGTIYIRADGSVDPSTAPILNDGNIYYTFTASIQGSIAIERDNIVFDGANNALQGTGVSDSKGIDLTGRSNVTITNTKIRDFEAGVHLSSAYHNVLSQNDLTNNVCGIYLEFSSNNTLGGNSVTNNEAGVYLESSSNNTLSGNFVRNNELYSVHLLGGSDNVLSQNDLTNNEAGVYLEYSSYNTFLENSIANNQYGIWLYESSVNNIYYNNFTDNAEHAHSQASTNFWDDEYSSGNYWSDYEERYPDAEELDGSGVWNTPYVIDENNQDNYPLVNI
jgi:parallel beta-helix repeat protein